MIIKIQKALDHSNRLIKNGNVREAQKLYEETLKEYSQNEEIKKILIVFKSITNPQEPQKDIIQSIINMFSSGARKEAIDKIEFLIKEYPQSSLLFNVSGAFHNSAGQFEIAVKKFKQAIVINSNYAEAHYNLGVVLKELGQIKAAIKSYKNALSLKNEYPDAHNNLGNILLNLDQIDSAARHFELAILFNPNFAQAYNNLGITNKRQGLSVEARRNFDKALAIKPNYAEALNSRGIIYQEMLDYKNAIKFYQKALSIKPNFENAYNNIGIAEKELNNIDNAIKSFKKALSINPNFANAYYNLFGLKKYSGNKEEILKIKSLLANKNTKLYDRIALNFALAKSNEIENNQYDFFNYLHIGNNLRKKELNYKIEISQKQFSKIREISNLLSSSTLKSLPNISKDISPIFILGMPRSGTSLVEQIISSHNKVHGAGELNNLGILFSELLDEFSNNEYKNKVPKKSLTAIRNKYIEILKNLNVPEKIITDKAPGNFRFIGLIMALFPDAKIIHLKRDPMATCWSIYNRNWSGNGYPFSYNLEDLSKYYALYLKLMSFWHKKFPGKIYDISYEDLTLKQKEETKKLLKYCDLEWDENCLKFHKNKRIVKTASLLQVKQKMYQGSSESWKKYEAFLGLLIEGLNYK